ncbi:MAG: hypothetical protein WC532_07025 [Candidatus Omnitrophota bacterium]
MKKAVILLVIGLFLSGCTTAGIPCQKEDIVKTYAASTAASKNSLLQDLTSGKIAVGATLDSIRSEYGNADDMLIAGCIVRLIYRPDSGKNITLWFDDGKHLSMWSG